MTAPLLIRADGSASIGTGHVMRCLALAQAWCHRGGTAVFVQAETTAALLERLRSEKMTATTIDATPGSDADAQQTIEIARSLSASWLVADGYRFGAGWQKRIRDAGLRLLVIDDYGHAEHYHANVILNQNASAGAALYTKRDADTHLLLGTRFALLRREFIGHKFERTLPESPRRILVTLGGSDPDNVTEKVITALLPLKGIEATVVAGGSNPNIESLKAATARHPAIQLLVNPSNMPKLIARADMAIAAGGSTSWELAYLGLPSIVIVLADNQEAIAAELHRRNVCVCLGDHRTLATHQITAAVKALLGDVDRRRIASTSGSRLVDGHGASRIAAALGAKLVLTFVSDATSWLNEYLPELKRSLEAAGHAVHWTHDPASIGEGDIAFFLSLSRIVSGASLRRHAHNLVVHESALPQGRGWSPLTWQVLEGKNEIPITLFEAAEGVDSGDIYAQDVIALRGDELVHELRAAQAAATLKLCRDFVDRYPFVLADARSQTGEPTYYERRRPDDSRLDPDKTIREQFNLLRVADPEKYPAYFEMAGRKFEVRVTAV